MNSMTNYYHQAKQTATRSRKRGRSSTSSMCNKPSSISKATMLTSMLCLVAFTAIPAKAFVLATTGTGSSNVVTTSAATGGSSNKLQHVQQQQLQQRTSSILHAPSIRPTTTTSKQDDSTTLFSAAMASCIPPEELFASLQQQGEDVEDEPFFDFSAITTSLLPGLIDTFKHTPPTATTVAPPTVTVVPTPVAAPKIPDEEDVLEWAGRYTSVEALREHFGTNQNKLWGDLQASTARRLYKTLLPRALLELSQIGQLQPQDLAPLAYQARVAAKLYARERCTVPARLAATLFDGFRQWIKYGKFQAHGMTYDQLWEKYAEKILEQTELSSPAAAAVLQDLQDAQADLSDDDDDEEEECHPFHSSALSSSSDCEGEEDFLSEQVCRKILERACVSNESVDALALRGADLADETELQPSQRRLLNRIRSQLEQDMYQLLLKDDDEEQEEDDDDNGDDTAGSIATCITKQGRRFRLVKGLAKRRRFWMLKRQLNKAHKNKLMEDDVVEGHHHHKPAWLSRYIRSDDADSDSDETMATIVMEGHDDDEALRP